MQARNRRADLIGFPGSQIGERHTQMGQTHHKFVILPGSEQAVDGQQNGRLAPGQLAAGL
jgi:hypothetical protein